MDNGHQRTSADGCSTFFNIGTASTRFRHVFSGGDGNLTGVGQEIADNYSMTMPPTAPISRPFDLDYGGAGGTHWNNPPYSTNRYTASLFETYYSHGAGVGSGLVKLVNPAGTKAGYVVVNGIDRAVDSGTTFIAKFAVLSLVHSFLEVGDTGNTLRILQLPRLEIESPTDITELNDPSSIDILYGIEWARWDGSPVHDDGHLRRERGVARVRDHVFAGQRRHVAARAGRYARLRPERGRRRATVIADDAGAGDETYTWSVPSAQFPEGSYLIRIDCYREGAQVHYSWHQNKIFIQR